MMENNKLLIFILMVGVFGILNTEMGFIGILPYIAESYDVTIVHAGLLISLFALGVAIAGPIMPLVCSRFNRKYVMLFVFMLWVSIAAVVFLNGSIFGVFNYLADYLESVSGIMPSLVSIMLFVYGICNIFGSMLAGNLLTVRPLPTVTAFPFAVVVIYLLLYFGGSAWSFMAVLTILWGLLGGINANINQFWISRAAPEATDFANGLFLTATNLGCVFGTSCGGFFIDSFGMAYVVWGSIRYTDTFCMKADERFDKFMAVSAAMSQVDQPKIIVVGQERGICMDLDGNVSAADARLILRASVGLENLAEGAGLISAERSGERLMQKEELSLTQEWDKVFPQSNKVNHKKVTFVNRYGITLAADMYTPKDAKGKLPAIAVSGPFGAVKEQSSGLYAQEMAERGFLTIAFDPSFTGESGGTPRYVASPDINTEDFSAAVDFLSVQDNIDPGRIGIIGICGWGGMALNAAAMDTRVKATVASTMYDMSRVTANGYFDMEKDANTLKKERQEMRQKLNAQRTEDYRKGAYKNAGGVIDPLPKDAPQFVKDYYAYYKTKRGYHPRSLNSNNGWNVTSALSFMNMPLLSYSDEIQSAVLVIHGEKAHSRYFGEDAFKKLKGENKELMIIPGASHTDLYDRKNIIPFDKIEAFFRSNLK